jgi:hypothetical protein
MLQQGEAVHEVLRYREALGDAEAEEPEDERVVVALTDG